MTNFQKYIEAREVFLKTIFQNDSELDKAMLALEKIRSTVEEQDKVTTHRLNQEVNSHHQSEAERICSVLTNMRKK